MQLKQLEKEGVAVFVLRGEIDMHFSPLLRATLQENISSRCRALVLDFSAVRFIDSCGISAILEYIGNAAEYGGVLCLAAPSEDVQPILEVVRLETVTPIFGTLDEAVAAVQAGGVTSRLQPVMTSAPG
ncbi:hypothetical protein BH20VER1_BH20VER1_18280 [soil metagenome]